jgi:hypothetical protein
MIRRTISLTLLLTAVLVVAATGQPTKYKIAFNVLQD